MAIEHMSATLRRVSVFFRLAGLIFLLAFMPGCGSDRESESIKSANESMAAGLYLEAEKKYEEYLRTFPQGKKRGEAWHALLEIADNLREDPKRSIDLLEAMILEFSDDPRKIRALSLRAAEIYGPKMGRWEKTVALLEKTRGHSGQDANEQWRIEREIALAWRAMGKYDRALNAYNRSIRDVTEKEKVDLSLYDSSQVLLLMGKVDPAKEILEKLARDAGNDAVNAMAAVSLADIYLSLGLNDKARKLLESALWAYPNPEVVRTKLDKLGKNRKQPQ